MISAYHQRHCLNQLHLSFVARNGAGAGGKRENREKDIEESRHLGHRFEYLQQAITYAADATLMITEEEAQELSHPTIAIPRTNDYLIQLDI